MKKIFLSILFLLLTSCSHHKLKLSNQIEILKSLKFSGESRCRLTYKGKQELFSCESIFKNQEWIFVVAIPFQGEKIFSFSGLNQKNIKKNSATHSLDELNDIFLSSRENVTTNVLQAMHTTLRFLKMKNEFSNTECIEKNAQLDCSIDEQKFEVRIKDSILIIQSEFEDMLIEIVGEFPSENGYKKTSLHLKHKKGNDFDRSLLVIEFFWKS